MRQTRAGRPSSSEHIIKDIKRQTALDLAMVGRQQSLERREVVALDKEIVVKARFGGKSPGPIRYQFVEWHCQVVVFHQHLSLEL